MKSKIYKSPGPASSDWVKIPNKDCYTLLAQLKEIKFVNFEGKNKIYYFNNERWELLWNEKEKSLLGIKKKLLKKIPLDKENFQQNPAYQMVKVFKDYDFDCAYTADLKEPLKFEKLGKAVHVVYRSDKWNKHKFFSYIHEFGEDGSSIINKSHGVNLFYNKKNRLFLLKGGRLIVNQRGIIY